MNFFDQYHVYTGKSIINTKLTRTHAKFQIKKVVLIKNSLLDLILNILQTTTKLI